MPPNHPAKKHWGLVSLRAKELRKVQTPAEQALWSRLRNRGLSGLKFRRQHPIGPFIADFYCAQHRLVIELDGGVHRKQAEQDAKRTAQLAAYGFRVLRVQNEEVQTDLESVLRKIAEACGTTALLPCLGEGQADECPPG
jgi:very-short-patch-repair endonuclease